MVFSRAKSATVRHIPPLSQYSRGCGNTTLMMGKIGRGNLPKEIEVRISVLEIENLGEDGMRIMGVKSENWVSVFVVGCFAAYIVQKWG